MRRASRSTTAISPEARSVPGRNTRCEVRVNVVTVFELEVTGSAAIRFLASPDLGSVEA